MPTPDGGPPSGHSGHSHGHAHHDAMAQGDPAGRVDHSGHEALFRRRFWVCLALSVPAVVYSEFVQETLGSTAPAFPGSE